MTINALNSGAKVWLADLEDANTPHFANVIDGQANLYDAIRRQIDYTSPDGKRYELADETATIVMRPRGWHLTEKHLTVGGDVMVGSLVDFGLYFFHNARELVARGVGPYFYLPKLESHLEARLWRDVFVFAEDFCGLPRGTIRATVLIETIPAAFEMDEILYELRDHSAGLNAGRWDYIFSYIKVFSQRSDSVFPDRAQVTMATHFLSSAADLLVNAAVVPWELPVLVTRACNNYGRFQLGGDLRLIGTASAPALSGRTELREGGRLFVGRNIYDIQPGSVINFANPTVIEPEMNIQATTNAGGVDITVTITGTAEAPSVDLQGTDIEGAELSEVGEAGAVVGEGHDIVGTTRRPAEPGLSDPTPQRAPARGRGRRSR